MNILYICNHNPFATSGGGGMASHAFSKAFSDISEGCMDLVCSEDLKEGTVKDIKCNNIFFVPARNKYSKILSVFTGEMNRYTEYVKKLLINNSNYDWVVFDHSCIAGPLIKHVSSLGIRTITIHHNYEKEYFYDNNKGLYRSLFLRHVIKWERIAYQNSCINLFLTRSDQNKFAEVYGETVSQCYSIGVFEYNNKECINISTPIRNTYLTFAISGSLCNYQTYDGISYFFRDLYTCLPSDCKIIIAGRSPKKEIIELCNKHKNVELVANPIDINEIIRKADVYLCPTKIGGGLKLRVMDGLKNGLPVITHVCSSRGFDCFEGSSSFMVFSTTSEFASCVKTMTNLISDRKIDNISIQKCYKNYFSYEAGLSRIKEIITKNS